MRICAAQIKPVKGDIAANIARHETLIGLAASYGAGLVIFPELSVSGYEPLLAKELATTADDKRFDVFQQLSDGKHITIGVGMPVSASAGVQIGMIVFQPQQPRKCYAKQLLHEDEFPYFICGEQQLMLHVKENKIAPAICYESLQPAHSENAFKSGAGIYFASVAKPSGGVEKAFRHFPLIAAKYEMIVAMSNCTGPCDNFESVGNTAIWDRSGALAGQLNDSDEGVLIMDTQTKEVIVKTL